MQKRVQMKQHESSTRKQTEGPEQPSEEEKSFDYINEKDLDDS